MRPSRAGCERCGPLFPRDWRSRLSGTCEAYQHSAGLESCVLVNSGRPRERAIPVRIAPRIARHSRPSRLSPPNTAPVVRRPAVNAGSEVLSVAELDRRLRARRRVDQRRRLGRGRGRVAQACDERRVYFTLKDESEDAIVECVMYKFDAQRSRKHLVEGRASSSRARRRSGRPAGGSSSWARSPAPPGRGALLEALEQLKQAPFGGGPVLRGAQAPAAARSQGRRRRHQRGRRRLSRHPYGGVPARVGAPRARAGLGSGRDGARQHRPRDRPHRALPGARRPDRRPRRRLGRRLDGVQRRARRAARRARTVPVVSAVGHEVDITLTDLAPTCAPRRRRTPRSSWCRTTARGSDRLRGLGLELGRALEARLAGVRNRLYRAEARLSDPRFTIAERQEELDELVERLEKRFERIVGDRRARLGALRAARLPRSRHPRVVIGRAKRRVRACSACGSRAPPKRFMRERRAELRGQGFLRGSTRSSPLAVLVARLRHRQSA